MTDASRWVSKLGTNEWIEVDLGATKKISRLVVSTGYGSGYAMKSFKLLVKNSAGVYVDVPGASVSGNSPTKLSITLNFSAASGRIFRLQCRDQDHARVRELQLWGN